MDVLVTGSSGFIGAALLPALVDAGYRPIRAMRGRTTPKGVDAIAWDPDAGTIDAPSLEGLGAVVHLAGAGIGDARWTDARKRVILESRTKGTSLLVGALAGLSSKPAVLVSSSAIGYYGSARADQVLTEDSPPGDDFVASVCKAWEAAAKPAEDAGIRLVCTRTGIVLGRNGGVLKRLLVPFKLGLGGRVASGKQWMSWVALDDVVAAFLHAIRADSLRGPANVTAPNPATNAELTTALGKAVHRPTVLPTPLLPVKARFGSELVEHLLVEGQRVVPKVLEASGFTFRHPTLDEALRSILAKPEAA